MTSISPATHRATMTKGLATLFAFCCGAIVANLYYAQPIIGLIAPDIGLSGTLASFIVSLTQIGYAVGLLFLVPLADLLESRRLMLLTTLAAMVCLLAAGFSTSPGLFLGLSLLVGCLVVVLSLIFGVIFGLIAGYVGGAVDAAIMRLVDIMLALPSLLLALVLVAIFGPSIVNASIALTFVALPHYIRLTRAAVLVEVTRDYVTASRVAGAGAVRQMFINILPNCLAPLIVQASLGFSNAILDMAALGFLGMGAQPPTPEWGTMLSDVLQFAQSAWWVVTFPGVAILLTVLAFNLMGDGLRDALDPKLKQ